MKKNISANDLTDSIRDDPYIAGGAFARVKRYIDDAPAVDAVEVVPCKECKHNNMNGGDCNRTLTLYCRDPVLELNVAEHIKLEHCSHGERR